ncbi:MAG: hypothetical protein ACREJC_17575 [Tepidisphaeraceae bacterium]
MPKDIFHDRERAEEAVYFSKQDAKLIEKLREKARLSEVAHALAEKLQVDNPELLRRITDLGVTLDTGAAFILAPLIQVAWADGKVSHAEQDTVVRLAAERGIAPGSGDHSQVLAWLAAAPSPALFDTALEAIRVGLSVLPRSEAEERIERVINACREVAEASGGLPKLLHLQSGASATERLTIDAIRATLLGNDSGPKQTTS